MLNEISQHAAHRAKQNFVEEEDSLTQKAAKGKLLGKGVIQVITPQSILQDAMEELSYNFNKCSDFALRSRKEREQATKSIKDKYKVYSKLCEDSLLDSAEQLIHGISEDADREKLLDDALSQQKEPAEAWATLELARDLLEKRGASKEVLKEFDEAIALLDMRFGAAVRAGICGTLTAAEGYVSLGQPQESGATYKKSVLEFSKPLDLYSYIVNKYDTSDIDTVIDFLYASLTADMQCDAPSCDKVALERVNNNLGRLRNFQSANAIFTKQLERWNNVYNIKDCPLKSIDLIGKTLSFGEEKFISGSEIDDLAKEAKAPDIEHRIFFLQEYINNLRSIPPMFFEESESRLRILDATQNAIDSVINEEDTWLESQN